MNYILFDGPSKNDLLPFTFTRPVADIRIGILTIREKWEAFLEAKTSTKTEDHLSGKWPLKLSEKNVFIDSSVIPTESLVEKIIALKPNEKLVKGDRLLAYFQNGEEEVDISSLETINFEEEILTVDNTWDIFSKNGEAISLDFDYITKDRQSAEIPHSNFVKAAENIFIEEGAEVENCSLNASSGTIYIGKNATIMEGSLIRGPFAVCQGAIIKMGAKIYGPTTVGPYCKVGGEVNNSVFFQNSNKGHDGFLGNSVLGEWCNIGADSNNSNLKNNYAEVRLWNYNTENFARTGLQFCGLIMGDHSKCGINTMFNTGTVVGVSANIFGSGFPRNFIPGFSWGGSAGTTTYKLEKALETMELVLKRRNVELTQHDRDILKYAFEYSAKWRKA
ncbi:UDP-N-acetylglucosamine diphosphorylase/glucosamine-1-phosphate N-acetyltransferase [Christiangramia gaetbulicola]|uniref:UDP-N-acetylglucosamine diphosphorylase/glucosamine-1-phosphate N-acetyltransferase n=1 Tax=Christiangramia gaetbulicola TaxID=703340 RepID=A0A2T6AHK8_9FLAO|nr:GlmU family protein [Christiangramia gaetbulicola]PTX43313.1 UDP-N-acetylglucosamine diphosphorylase/glucosamine-1-phosphate N-acetyltransferase [Christiangramia gaetbulicola]